MKNKEQYKRLISACSIGLLVATLTLVFGCVWYQYYADTMVLPFYRRGNWTVIWIYAVLVVLIFRTYGGLRVGYLRRMEMAYSQMLGICLVNGLTYLQISLIGRHFMALRPMVWMTLIDLALVLCWVYLANKLYFLIYKPRRLVVVYGSPRAAELVLKMSSRVDKYMICESINVSNGIEQVKEEILNFEGIILCDVPAQMRDDLVKYCFDHSLRAYISPKISDIILRGADDIRLFDTPLLLCRNSGLSFGQRFVKRCFDLVISLILLVLTSPLLLISALAVACSGKGGIIYRQTRLTEDGKTFALLKFRSMIEEAEEDGVARLCTDADGRITPAGRILRKFRLDELPQLFNILRGDMSLVGPRPERPELAEQYEREMPEFRYRLHVKAGLTGYAQVTGAYDTNPYDKLKMDLMYIEQYSLLLDFKILMMTVKTILFPPKTNEAGQPKLMRSRSEEENSESE